MTAFHTGLRVPADMSFAPLLAEFVADAARRSGLETRADAIVQAARLGFEAIVETAMVESRDAVRALAACSATHLTIALVERGIPIADRQARREPRWQEILQRADCAQWYSHGTAGSELRLVFDRPLERLPQLRPQPQVEPLEGAQAPPQEYTIRRFVPEDAEGVARAFYLTYGYHYDFPAVYVPSRLIEINAAGSYVSIVAVAENGEIAGHYALARDDDDPIADAGGAVVVPAHRGRDLLNRLRRQAEVEATRLGLAAYYSEPVTDHGRTQRASESFGAKACGLTLGLSPRGFVPKQMELSTTTQRQSFMLYVRVLRERERRTIYPPPHHRTMIEKIYAGLGLAVEMRDGAAPEEAAVVHTGIVRADDVGTIDVVRAGIDSSRLARQAVDDLRAVRRLGAIFASLPLEDPGTPALCEALESCGFYFSGVGPWMMRGADVLRLQMPLTPIDLSALTVVSDFGKELLAYVAAERARCAGSGEAVR